MAIRNPSAATVVNVNNSRETHEHHSHQLGPMQISGQAFFLLHAQHTWHHHELMAAELLKQMGLHGLPFDS